MKRLIPVLLAALLMLSGCGSPEPPVEPQPSSAPVSSEMSSQAVSSAPEVSSEVVSASSEAVSSETISSEPASSENATSEPASSETTSSEVTVLPPVESEAVPELACPLASSQPFSQEQAPASSAPATSSEPPASSAVSEYVVPEDERPMTDAEVDALIAEAIAYAESKGMTWKDDYSLSNDIQGYNPPGNSESGYRACKEMVFYNIDDLYNLNLNSNFHQEGSSAFYKIEKGRIEPFEGWFIYVLY